MSNKKPTFESVNAHFEKADLTPYAAGGQKHFSAASAAAKPGDVLKKICSIYQVVRPFLALASTLPLIPAKWKTAIKTFMTLMDTLCPA